MSPLCPYGYLAGKDTSPKIRFGIFGEARLGVRLRKSTIKNVRKSDLWLQKYYKKAKIF
jgi:hypothetical protein